MPEDPHRVPSKFFNCFVNADIRTLLHWCNLCAFAAHCKVFDVLPIYVDHAHGWCMMASPMRRRKIQARANLCLGKESRVKGEELSKSDRRSLSAEVAWLIDREWDRRNVPIHEDNAQIVQSVFAQPS